MTTTLTSFKSVDSVTAGIIEGTTIYGIAQGVIFASGETTKYMLIEIPVDVAVQFIVQGLTIVPYDNTFRIRMIENVTTLTTGTTLIIQRNMNRNYSDVPLSTVTLDPVGVYGLEGIILEDFNPYIRQTDFTVASKILKDNVERILKANTKYLFEFSRTIDTAVLEMEFRFIYVEN